MVMSIIATMVTSSLSFATSSSSSSSRWSHRQPTSYVISSRCQQSSRIATFTDKSLHATNPIDIVVEGPFDPQRQLPGYWTSQPLLIQNAFSPPSLTKVEENVDSIQVTDDDFEQWISSWWSESLWEMIVDLACQGSQEKSSDEFDESEFKPGNSARLIQSVSEKPNSYTLDIGPFDKKVRRMAMRAISETKNNNDSGMKTRDSKNWTILVNDVDRYIPALSSWIDYHFAFLPRWRRDDAQVSIAGRGGGIGPHVDNYDVFLIQVSGTRTWQIGLNKISVQQEYESLLPDLPVRILPKQCMDPCIELDLKPGDMLYLPPRVPHCGTAISNDCITLSVGCRAPSAAELVIRLAEALQETAVQRYADPTLLVQFQPGGHYESKANPIPFVREVAMAKTWSQVPPGPTLTDQVKIPGPTLTDQVKIEMKQLLRAAIDDLLDRNEAAWDAVVGRIVTEPIRLVDMINVPTVTGSEDSRITESISPREVVQRIVSSRKGMLRRTPGVSVATSRVVSSAPNEKEDVVRDRLFCHGEMYEVVHDEVSAAVFDRIERGQTIDSELLLQCTNKNTLLADIIENLIGQGILYAE